MNFYLPLGCEFAAHVEYYIHFFYLRQGDWDLVVHLWSSDRYLEAPAWRTGATHLPVSFTWAYLSLEGPEAQVNSFNVDLARDL